MLLAKVKKTIDRFGMLKPGERVLVAVSGGPDSACLLSALRALSAELRVSLHIAHLDHMFRGRESAEEALFVAGLAKKLNITATIEKIDVPAFCRERGLSAQTGAREVRYGFLNRVAEKVGAARIATGHTATDQAETFLMRLMRGAGVSALAAIPPKRENIIRPLIEVTREEVLEYLQSSGFEYVSDPSNAKPVYTRNRIRLEVLPVLKQFNPRIIETLAAEAALFRDEDEALEGCLAAIAAGVITQEKDGVVLQREKFNALPQAFRRRLLRKAANRAGAESSGLSVIQIDEALDFMAAARTGRIMRLPYGLVIEREYEKFIICPQAAAEGFSHVLALPGVTAIPELGMQVETMIIEGAPAEQEDKNYFWQALFDCDKIGPLLTLRSRRPGDRFRPAGMGGGSKKLQDFFVDAKIPRRKRDTVPLLVAGDDILWVAGLRTDERFLPRADTKKILIIRMRKAVGPEPETAP